MTLPPLSPRLLALQPPAVRAALTPGAPGAPPKRARRATGRTVAAGASAVAVERRGDGSLVVSIPGLRLVNGTNDHTHWRVRQRRAKRERTLVAAILGSTKPPPLPVAVTITRVGPVRVDGDGATAGAKHVRDELARWLKCDDGDESAATWVVVTERGPFAVRIVVASDAAETAAAKARDCNLAASGA